MIWRLIRFDKTCVPCLCLTVPTIPQQISKKDAGVYEVKLKDERGKDKTLLNLTDAGRSHFVKGPDQNSEFKDWHPFSWDGICIPQDVELELELKWQIVEFTDLQFK